MLRATVLRGVPLWLPPLSILCREQDKTKEAYLILAGDQSITKKERKTSSNHQEKVKGVSTVVKKGKGSSLT